MLQFTQVVAFDGDPIVGIVLLFGGLFLDKAG